MSFNDLKTKPKILIGICSPLVLLVILGAVAIYNINTITKTAGWVDHTRVVLAESSAIVGSAVDMETGMRGYLLAGQEGFLDPYKSGETTTYKKIAELQETVADNPGQIARLQEIEQTLHSWQSEVTEPTIALRRQIGNAKTMDDMADLVGKARGKVFFDKFRKQIEIFAGREQSLLKNRRSDFASAQGRVTEQFRLVDKTIAWVSHTYRVLAAAKEILANAVDMETGMRGYLLAGENEFLDPYNSGQKAFAKNITALQNTVSDNPPQVTRLKKAEKLISDWQKKVTEPAIKLRRQVHSGNGSLGDIETMVGRKAGKKFFDAFRGVIAEFSAIEAELLVKRQADAKMAAGKVTDDLKVMKDNEGWVTHSYKVIDAVNSVLSAAVNMETGMRGYLLAGQDGFLEPYKNGGAKFNDLTSGLLETVRDNAAQVELMTEIRQTIADWQKNVTEPTIQLRRDIGDSKTMNDMAKLVGEAHGKVFFDKFRGIMADFQAEEQGLMEQRQDNNIKTVNNTFMLIGACIIIALILGLGMALLIGNRIANPIKSMTETMASIAGGDLKADVPGVGRADEIGEMAEAVQVFKDNAVERTRLESEQEQQKLQAEEEKRAVMNKMADDFQGSVGHVIQSVSSAATEMQASAEAMTGIAEQTRSQASNVAAASDQAAANVQTVASAAEELSSSINEIARQVSTARSANEDAVSKAGKSEQTVQELVASAQKIGEVVALISDVAEQTNLLALNATIEAARAGDAGKGFAVVASEVKNLANQTAKATEDIRDQIANIQGVAEDAASSIRDIGGSIAVVSENTTGVSAAVEEQDAATQEIARNVEQAATGTRDVAANVSLVTKGASETGSAATQMLSTAKELAQQSERLDAEVGKFLDSVRGGQEAA